MTAPFVARPPDGGAPHAHRIVGVDLDVVGYVCTWAPGFLAYRTPEVALTSDLYVEGRYLTTGTVLASEWVAIPVASVRRVTEASQDLVDGEGWSRIHRAVRAAAIGHAALPVQPLDVRLDGVGASVEVLAYDGAGRGTGPLYSPGWAIARDRIGRIGVYNATVERWTWYDSDDEIGEIDPRTLPAECLEALRWNYHVPTWRWSPSETVPHRWVGALSLYDHEGARHSATVELLSVDGREWAIASSYCQELVERIRTKTAADAVVQAIWAYARAYDEAVAEEWARTTTWEWQAGYVRPVDTGEVSIAEDLELVVEVEVGTGADMLFAIRGWLETLRALEDCPDLKLHDAAGDPDIDANIEVARMESLDSDTYGLVAATFRGAPVEFRASRI